MLEDGSEAIQSGLRRVVSYTRLEPNLYGKIGGS